MTRHVAITGIRSVTTLLVLFIFITSLPPQSLSARKPKLNIVDYTSHLNKKFKRIKRKSTQYIIVHTSEAGLTSTLESLSRGKDVGRYRTYGGHGNYAIARDGRVYRMMNPIYRADHAGLSMWNGTDDLSSHSIGIEIVGYHYSTITNEQYRSLARLLEVLQKRFRVLDKNVLTHCQVSYGRPNFWHKRPHRGRKRCALNFEREKAGLKSQWSYDPDVKAGRLTSDYHIHTAFYRKRPGKKKKSPPDIILAKKKTPETTPLNGDAIVIDMKSISPPSLSDEENIPADNSPAENISNIIGKNNTAWNIAGEDHDAASTLYILPDGRRIRGNLMGKSIGWARIPNGTQVLLNQPQGFEKKVGPVFTLSKEYTAWSYAQGNFNKPNTYYFMPDGHITPGNKMSDWDDLPDNTCMIINYQLPVTIGAIKGKTPWSIAGRSYNHPDTVYYVPGLGIRTGDQIKDFSDLPMGSKLFLKQN